MQRGGYKPANVLLQDWRTERAGDWKSPKDGDSHPDFTTMYILIEFSVFLLCACDFAWTDCGAPFVCSAQGGQ